MALIPIERLITGAAAWFLADCRHGRATRIQLDVLPGGKLRLSNDGGFSAAPASGDTGLETLLTQRGWRFTDGRLDWPDILGACGEWEIAVSRVSGSHLVEGHGAKITGSKDSKRPEPGARFTFTPDPHRTLGKVSSPDVLAALHAQARQWPDAKHVVKLPGYDSWRTT